MTFQIGGVNNQSFITPVREISGNSSGGPNLPPNTAEMNSDTIASAVSFKSKPSGKDDKKEADEKRENDRNTAQSDEESVALTMGLDMIADSRKSDEDLRTAGTDDDD